MSKKILWGLMTLSAIVVALYALGLLAAPSIRPPFIQNLFANFPEITIDPFHRRCNCYRHWRFSIQFRAQT